jgi:hypothetical protein
LAVTYADARALQRLLHLDHGPAQARTYTEAQWAGVLRAAGSAAVTPIVASVAVRAGVIPDVSGLGGQLAARLDEGGPFSATAALLGARWAARERTADLLDQGRTILAALERCGATAVPLKGLHLLLDGVWPDPAGRPMRDIDILVAPQHLTTARRVLAELGYQPHTLPYATAGSPRQPYGYLPGDHHDPPLHRPGHHGTVELHRRLLSRRHTAALDTAAVLDRAAGTGRMTAADLLALLVAHAQLTDHGRILGRLPLTVVLDVAYLLRARPDLDPERVAAEFPVLRRAVRTQLADAHHLAGVGAPRSRLTSVRWRAAALLTASPALRRIYRQLLSAPRAMAGERIREIYTVPAGRVPLLRARVHHVGRHLRPRRPAPGAAELAEAVAGLTDPATLERIRAVGLAARAVPLPATGFDASTPARVWRAAAAQARELGAQSLLMLADDVIFFDDAHAVARRAASDAAELDWDLIYLGGDVRAQVFPFVPGSLVLQQCGPVGDSPAVVLRRRAISRLLADLPGPDEEPGLLTEWALEWGSVEEYLRRLVERGTYRALITWPRIASRPSLLGRGDADLALASRYQSRIAHA